MTGTLYDHAYPVKITLYTSCPISSGSVKFEGTKPDGTDFQWSATVESATTGECYYLTTEDLLDQVGNWRIQAVWYPSGSNDGIPGKVATLEVRPREKAI